MIYKLNHKPQGKPTHGFTLIELLVVIAIIALLLGIIMPSLRRARGLAQSISCQSNLRQWNLILFTYTNENDDRFPDSSWEDQRMVPRGQWWFLTLRDYYIDQPDILLCATADRIQDTSAGAGPWVTQSQYFPQEANEAWGQRIIVRTHPDRGQWVWSSYAPNAWIMDTRSGTWPEFPDQFDDWFWGSMRNIRQPSEVPVFQDSRHVDGWPNHTDRPHSQEFGAEVEDWSRGYMYLFTMRRHGNSINMTFADGSSRSVPLTDLWSQKWHRRFNTNNPLARDEYEWPSWMQ